MKIERDLKPRELFLTAVLSACVSRSPERIKAIIVQNAAAHEQGLGPAWDKAFWKDRAAYEDKVIPGFVSLEGAKVRHLGSTPRPQRYDPAAWEGAHLGATRAASDPVRSFLTTGARTGVAAISGDVK